MATSEYLKLFNSVGTPPSSESQWEEWVSASKTRNFLSDDPLLDWLNLYGSNRGFQRDDEFLIYDSRTDFTEFILEQGRRFETAVVKYIDSMWKVVTVATVPSEIRNVETAAKTFELMGEGSPIIHQGVLFDPPSKTYGAPDLLVRSDYLDEIFPDAIDREVELGASPNLGSQEWYYLAVDIKFTTLKLVKSGDLGDSGSNPSYKTQLLIYNRALGWTQGKTPDHSFLLGRGWTQQSRRGSNCMERLAPVSQNGETRKRSIGELADDAAHWMRQVRLEGDDWEVVPEPTRPELYPNMGNKQDSPWQHAKKCIAEELNELTALWNVGVEKRNVAHQSGILKWSDPKCTAEAVGVTGSKQGPILQAILDVNQAGEGIPVRPERIQSVDEGWRTIAPLEFYVDFETVSDLADDFSNIPTRGGQPLIFMIGCGHIENGQWKFKCFVADAINESSEANIIDNWLSYMTKASGREIAGLQSTPVIHWSQAEPSSFEKAYNSARSRHSADSWPDLKWFDFWKKVVTAEPVVVKGAMGFGLKEFANALHFHGLIETRWEGNSLDGLGAMVGAWWSHEEAMTRAVTLEKIKL
ncbi:MAG: hypothetical protein EA415_11075, partial [Sphaerobacteraceae bacterium]